MWKQVIAQVFVRKLYVLIDIELNIIEIQKYHYHESPMSKRGYKHLREMIFAGNGALLKTCCRINPNRTD